MAAGVSPPETMLDWQPDSPWRMTGKVRADDLPTDPPPSAEGKYSTELNTAQDQLRELHSTLYASKSHAVLAIFQAYDAAGKDGTIRRAAYKLDPAGVEVHAFRKPTELELQHDFLWRCARVLPPKGKLGIFNRSYYEEVLTVRVNPAFLRAQFPRQELDLTQLWQERFAAINAFERHLVASGTRVVKFWLNVSRKEQRQRFLSRLDEPNKQWKFNPQDLEVAEQRAEYDQALTQMLNTTSTEWAPWFVIPADDKPYMRWQCTELLVGALRQLDLSYPAADPKITNNEAAYRARLQASEPW